MSQPTEGFVRRPGSHVGYKHRKSIWAGEWREGKDFGRNICFFNIVCAYMCTIYMIKFKTFEKQSQTFQAKPQGGSSSPLMSSNPAVWSFNPEG